MAFHDRSWCGIRTAYTGDDDLAEDADRATDIVLWNKALADVKRHETYYVRGGQVTGRFDQAYPALGVTATAYRNLERPEVDMDNAVVILFNVSNDP